MCLTTLIWWFISPRLHEISSLLAFIVLTSLRVFYVIIILGILTLFYECYSNYSIKYFHRLIRFSVNLLFPVNVFLGKFLNITKERIRESFISVNNSFIHLDKFKGNSKEILLLLPHCLQNLQCTYRVTNIIDNCIDCGKCCIKDLKYLSKEYDINIAIATGGTIARKIIIKTKPKLIIAVACQRDLVDGLLEVFPIPVIGLLNERPFEPCENTSVDVNIIKNILESLLRR